MSVAIAWRGGECPVHPGTTVLPEFRGPENGAKGLCIGWPCPAWRLDWSHDGSDDDIISYRIIEPSKEVH